MEDLQVKFEARSQREAESLDDYIEYFEGYCEAFRVEEETQLRLFMAYLNTKCRRRAKLMKNRLRSWDDVLKQLVGSWRAGSGEPERSSRILQQTAYDSLRRPFLMTKTLLRNWPLIVSSMGFQIFSKIGPSSRQWMTSWS